MSVRKGDREEGNLAVINASKDLISYTYDRVMDRNIFPKAERWLLCRDIWDCAVGVRSCIVRANSIRVETPTEAHTRLALEKKALGYLSTLETLIDLCYEKEKISENRMVYWGNLVVNTLKPLNGWIKSDRRRYADFLKQIVISEEQILVD